MVLTLINPAGLRGQEVINLKISGIDASTGSAQASGTRPYTYVKLVVKGGF